MLEVKNLTKSFGQHKVLDNISFTARPGEVLGLLGPNGAGKTTTMKIITGFWPAQSGTVLIDDLEVGKNLLAIKQRLGYLPETVPLYNELKVYEYLKFIAGLRQLSGDETHQRLKEVIERCGLKTVVAQDISVL